MQRAYLSPELPGGNTYRRCVYVNGACSQEKQPVMCRLQPASGPGLAQFRLLRGVVVTWSVQELAANATAATTAICSVISDV